MKQELTEYIIPASLGMFTVPIFNFLYGPEPVKYVSMFLLFFVLVWDFISGTVAAQKTNSYASEYGRNGAIRSGLILGLPVIGHQVDLIFNLPGVFFGFLLVSIMYHILKSMIANTIRMGWEKWIPVAAIEFVADELEAKAARVCERRKKIEENCKKGE